ncbi:MAG: hypothetical protein ACR2NR_14385 [Solirubrobacteraceae bacterium]
MLLAGQAASTDEDRYLRRDLWQSQNVRIEVWLEKDALADVVADVTSNWDVSLMVSRGQSSATYLYSAAQEAKHAYEQSGAVRSKRLLRTRCSMAP